jgi:hypothetical protein
MPSPIDQLTDNADALKRIIATMAQDAVNAQAEIAKLRFQLARYRRAEFDRWSEKLDREVDQLELAIETLEADQAERLAATLPIIAAVIEAAVESKRPARQALPDHLPRDDDRGQAAPYACPSCGGGCAGSARTSPRRSTTCRAGRVIRHIREKLSCRPHSHRCAGTRSHDCPWARRRRVVRPYRRLEV